MDFSWGCSTAGGSTKRAASRDCFFPDALYVKFFFQTEDVLDPEL